MKIQYFVVLALPLFTSCAGHPSPKNATTPVSLAPSAVQQADTTEAEAGGDSTAEGCVFDTTTIKMTAAALKRFDPNLAYTWRKKDGTAVVPMKNKDITRRLYQRDTIPRPDTKWYYIQDPDTTVTDHVYDGFGIWKAGGRAEIAVSGYIN